MTPEQMITITELLNQVEPVSMREGEDEGWVLDLGGSKETKVYADGSQFWYLNGKKHRTDGPASIYADGTQYWYLNGERHRTDGPAVICANGSQFWCMHGKELSEADHTEAVRQLKPARPAVVKCIPDPV